jgi:hypothetical protein
MGPFKESWFQKEEFLEALALLSRNYIDFILKVL